MTSTNTAIVIGVGAVEGLGASVALRAAKGGLHVVVAGRTESRLKDVVASIIEIGRAHV